VGTLTERAETAFEEVREAMSGADVTRATPAVRRQGNFLVRRGDFAPSRRRPARPDPTLRTYRTESV